MTKNTKTAFVSAWISIKEADKLIKKLIKEDTYEMNQIRKGPRRFANGKDKTGGYLTKVEVEAGIHPELELSQKGERVAMDPESREHLKNWKALFAVANIASITATTITLADGRKIRISNK